ncbi:hypothetical protein HAX54_024054 [Datura stramonium]|uniref:Uncharacterized protein n=1 Tax=Datura stramonium TaxID=4076 RepID=A0ABS8UXK7_DATST|nr:hypothetical protein [Datura stramonium]
MNTPSLWSKGWWRWGRKEERRCCEGEFRWDLWVSGKRKEGTRHGGFFDAGRDKEEDEGNEMASNLFWLEMEEDEREVVVMASFEGVSDLRGPIGPVTEKRNNGGGFDGEEGDEERIW